MIVAIPHTPDRRGRLQETIASIRNNCTLPVIIATYENNYDGWAVSVDRLLKPLDDIVLLLGCDVIVEPGCIEKLLEAYAVAFPQSDGVVEPYNELHHGSLVQHPCGHAQTIRKYLHTGYTHCFADNELHERLVLDNKYLYVPEAIIDHKHVVNGKAKMDKGYEFSLDHTAYEKDRELFNKRKANGFK